MVVFLTGFSYRDISRVPLLTIRILDVHASAWVVSINHLNEVAFFFPHPFNAVSVYEYAGGSADFSCLKSFLGSFRYPVSIHVSEDEFSDTWIAVICDF